MLSNVFLGMSMVGAEWVLYLLIAMSVYSVTLMFERARFYRQASRGLVDFRAKVRQAALAGRWEEALKAAESRRVAQGKDGMPDLESGLTSALLTHHQGSKGKVGAEVLSEVAQDPVVLAKIHWDKNLAALATIGNNAPFVGLFGTVLGIIKAFHDLANTAGAGVQGVSSGISEALIATAIGILVAIPAVIAFNLFQRRVKAAMAEAEAMKSFLVGKLAD